ncbi:hypothetical protein EVAR_103669_1 [Eumeta japonica]|uniref:Uncharacterized protein n=1 Tax=Eumeta variegata TaxID=151549 RepID=A0A4C1Z3Q5_EUMVA|nr:hypothetical protein EVAR_103669_1 [Eumeta japonica]
MKVRKTYENEKALRNDSFVRNAEYPRVVASSQCLPDYIEVTVATHVTSCICDKVRDQPAERKRRRGQHTCASCRHAGHA